MSGVLVIGAGGYVGSNYCSYLEERGVAVTRYTRDSGPGLDALDRVLALRPYEQVLSTPQLGLASTAFLLDRIDGPRWVVMSSAQLESTVGAPDEGTARVLERLAVARGARVLRPTMIFGRGGDRNISWTVRRLRRLGLVAQPGGSQLIQPLHVDDLISLFDSLREGGMPGVGDWGAPVPVGGDSPLAVQELIDDLVALVGRRCLRVPFGERETALVGRILRLRRDQVERLFTDKTVDNSRIYALTGWRPELTAIRLEQAVQEVALTTGDER